ncbi:MAG: thiamine pyrophosphate-binding protein [Thermoanaerobaculales bacterium]|nr:thiamine pyrophosphate-binding protein [Thermoanaerobaculales bacterium]
MKTRGSNLVVRALEDEGVKRVFGIPGTHNIELWDALEESKTIQPVLVTHECGAAFMADGMARASSEVGVLAVVPGAGVTHALSGVAEALMDNVPMVVLACGIRRDTGAAYQLHAIDQLAVLQPVTKEVWRVDQADDIYPTLRRAIAEARKAPQGPVAVEIAANLYMLTQKVEKPRWVGEVEENQSADRGIIEQTARLLTEARQPALYIGRGAEGASDLVVRLAEVLGAPVATTFQGKGVFPEDHPLWLWTGFGAQAPPFVGRIMAGCDVMLALGCRFSEVATGSYGITPPQHLIHVDVESEVLGRNYPADLVVACDARIFLEGLLEVLEGARPWGAMADAIAAGRSEVENRWENQSASVGKVAPHDLLKALQRHCRKDAIYTTDSGNGTFLAAEHLRLTGPRRFLAPVDFSCMGYAVPAAIGAALACPGRDVVALPGDGAFLMTGLELLTAAAYRCAPLVCVLRDFKLGQIAQFQKIPLNRETCSVLPDYSVSDLANSVGARTFRVVHESELDTVLPAALEVVRNRTPAVVEVVLDTSRKTYFAKGVVKTNFFRLPWGDRLRMLARALGRRII